MVKGTTRQVIVVRAPDTKLFEQAIFLLREDALERRGVGERELLEEARRVAESGGAPARRRRIPAPIWALVGAAPVAAAWLLTLL